MAVTDYSRTPSNNNSSPPNGFPEGQSAGSVNNCMRQVMTDIVNEAASNAGKVLASVAGTNTITATMTPDLVAYGVGMLVILTPAATNTGATTLNIDSLGALAVQNIDGTACVGGELTINIPQLLILNAAGNAFIIVSPANSRLLQFQLKSANYTFSQVDAGNLFYFSSTGLTITLPTTPLTSGSWIKIRNNGSGSHTLSSTQIITWYNGGGTIPTGSRTLAVGATIFVESDGTNYSIEGSGIS